MKKLNTIEKELQKDKKRIENLFLKEITEFNEKFIKYGLFATEITPMKGVVAMELQLCCNRTKMYENFPNLPELINI